MKLITLGSERINFKICIVWEEIYLIPFLYFYFCLFPSSSYFLPVKSFRVILLTAARTVAICWAVSPCAFTEDENPSVVTTITAQTAGVSFSLFEKKVPERRINSSCVRALCRLVPFWSARIHDILYYYILYSIFYILNSIYCSLYYIRGNCASPKVDD